MSGKSIKKYFQTLNTYLLLQLLFYPEKYFNYLNMNLFSIIFNHNIPRKSLILKSPFSFSENDTPAMTFSPVPTVLSCLVIFICTMAWPSHMQNLSPFIHFFLQNNKKILSLTNYLLCQLDFYLHDMDQRKHLKCGSLQVGREMNPQVLWTRSFSSGQTKLLDQNKLGDLQLMQRQMPIMSDIPICYHAKKKFCYHA